jgi:D-alanyl-lipoteichoic acid acyltransferase DltB (MBOAT superfamily)
MQFNSYIFIFAFLPIFLLLYFTLGKRWIRPVLIAGGAVFYALAGWKSVLVLAVSILITEGTARGIVRTEKTGRRKKLAAICVLLHAGALFFYKYWWVIPRLAPAGRFDFLNIEQPLGFSFLSFQQIMYVLALCRGEIREHHTLDYLSYILYFPKVAMGPLAEPGELILQIHDPETKKWNWYNMAAGLRIFSYGMFKKIVLADTFAGAVNFYFPNTPEASSLELAVMMLCYTFQIYFDFSGYIDMAAGISSMLNISLPVNFNSPYKALSVSDFWKRWHISLTRFFTRNIYIPLGGNRKGTARTYLNIMIVFLISGMWHGAHPNFLLWGALNGLLLVFERMIRRKDRNIPAPLSWLGTFLITNVLWLLFRSGTISQWLQLLRRILSFQGAGLSMGLTDAFFLPEIKALLRFMGLEGIQRTMPWIPMTVFLAAALGIVLIPGNNHEALMKKRPLSLISAFLAALALIWSVLCLSTESVFIYAGF